MFLFSSAKMTFICFFMRERKRRGGSTSGQIYLSLSLCLSIYLSIYLSISLSDFSLEKRVQDSKAEKREIEIVEEEIEKEKGEKK